MRLNRPNETALLAALVMGFAAVGLHGQPVRLVFRPAAPGAPAGGLAKSGLHLAAGKAVSLPRILNDGAGYRWDIQRYGSIGQGTGSAYSGGLYLYVNGSRVMFSGRGWANADGDEVEMGPYVRSSLRVYRRIKVYRDRGLARWLDIFENPTSQPIAVSVRIWSDMIAIVRQTVTSSGRNSFTSQDHAFVTACQIGSAPPLMHYVCSPRSKVRPTVTVRSDDIYVYYKFTVPAGDAVVLCYFESQDRSAAALVKLMKAFRPSAALKDLPASLRRRLINMPALGGYGGVELQRSSSSDVVHNRHGDPIFGTIINESFHLETLFGPMTVPASQVIGLASAAGESRQFRVLLTGGQIVAGRLADDARLELRMPVGAVLRVPFADVRQCAFRISKQRPEEIAFAGPLIVLRTGDRVAFDPASVKLSFRTRHGVVRLAPEDLLTVALDKEANGVHRATFLNGSRLAGFLEPRRIPLRLKLGPEATVSRDLMAEVRFAAEEKPDPALDAVVLSNGDELFGRLAEETLTLQTRYGKAALSPENVRAISFSRTHLGRASLELWDGSVLRGQCGKETLAFQIAPSTKLDICISHYSHLRRSGALPPKAVLEKLRRLLGKLAAESYKDRQAATAELVRMGKGILPILRKHLGASDPEVRQRVEDVIRRLGGKL
ncbi:MAG: hypothetical protein WBF17_16695 [Phycisphaerae bacterium]